MRPEVGSPQWFLLLLVAVVVGMLSGCRSCRDLERFVRRHRQALNQALRLARSELAIRRDLSLYLYPDLLRGGSSQPDGYNKPHPLEYGQALQAWMISQIPGGATGPDQLVCDGRTRRGSAVTWDGKHCYGLRPTVSVLKVPVDARALGVALAPMDLEGVLIQADARMTVKGNQGQRRRQIREQFKYGRRFQLNATPTEPGQVRTTTWTLRAREATEAIRQICSDSAMDHGADHHRHPKEQADSPCALRPHQRGPSLKGPAPPGAGAQEHGKGVGFGPQRAACEEAQGSNTGSARCGCRSCAPWP